jgi:hypothetical protein
MSNQRHLRRSHTVQGNGRIQLPGGAAIVPNKAEQQQFLNHLYQAALMSALPGVITGRICTSPHGEPVDAQACAAEAQAVALASLPMLVMSVQIQAGPPPSPPDP